MVYEADRRPFQRSHIGRTHDGDNEAFLSKTREHGAEHITIRKPKLLCQLFLPESKPCAISSRLADRHTDDIRPQFEENGAEA